MNKFFTLIRRDMADNRGALIITPLVIAAIVLILGTFSTIAGNANFGVDPKDFKGEFSVEHSGDNSNERNGVSRDSQGRVTITTPNGTKSLNETNDIERDLIVTLVPATTAVVGLIPIGVVAIVILFLLSGALYDERKDRTILFWKSMPVSDLATASAKMISIVLLGFGVALLTGMAMQLGVIGLVSATFANAGVTGVPFAAILTNVTLLWLVGLVALITYIGWALPIYAWFLAVGAATPKAPFIAAIVPLALAPVIARVLSLPGDIDIWTAPLRRLAGAQAFQNITKPDFDNLDEVRASLQIRETITEITSSMALPNFWIGLVIAVVLIYVASEIRRRRAL